MKNQATLNEYFRQEWSGEIVNLKYSGPALIDKILPGEHVIDIGCGENYFKGKIPNLLGIDPAFDQADLNVTIEEFKTDQKFDVAFCLGSINFGDYFTIKDQILKLDTLMKQKSRIYWRYNPGRQDHDTKGCKNINFFPWSNDWIYHFADIIGFTVTTIVWEENLTNPLKNNRRLYSEWCRGD
jgi:hypothetical protein